MNGLWPLLLLCGFGGHNDNCCDNAGCKNGFDGSLILPLLLFSCGGFDSGKCRCGGSCGENCQCYRQ